MDVGDAEREGSGFAFLEELLIELLPDLLDQLLDAGRMDAAVLHEALERDAGDLAADRIEAGEDDRFRRVVDDEVDAGGQLQRADVASFAADDAALHVFAREIDDGDRVLGDVVRGHALDGHAEDLARLQVAELVGFGLDALDDVGGVELGLVLDPADQLAARACSAVRPAICSSLWRCSSISAPSSPSRARAAFSRVGDARGRASRPRPCACRAAASSCRGSLPSAAGAARRSSSRRGAAAPAGRNPTASAASFSFASRSASLALRLGGLPGVLEDSVGVPARFFELRRAALAIHHAQSSGEHDCARRQPMSTIAMTIVETQTAPPCWEACAVARKFGEPRLSRVWDSYLNLQKTGGRSTRAVLATFHIPHGCRSGRRRARGHEDASTRSKKIIGSRVRSFITNSAGTPKN